MSSVRASCTLDFREEKRGRWSFYSLDGEAAASLLGDAGAYLCTAGLAGGQDPGA